MRTVHLTLSDEAGSSLDDQMRAAGFHDLSAYLQALLDADRRRLAQARLEQDLREGFESGGFVEWNEEASRNLREEFERRSAERNTANDAR